ncbi:MAG: peptidoglycan editing factor PgeF [Lachnospiraceae bacterium]|nr:peptidoglycan editing factor PgeF [Lachnospiraceae bacterium]
MKINYIHGRGRSTDLISKPGAAPYIAIRPFSEFDHIISAFSTRLGGVSSSIYESMNLAGNRGDDPENVRKNFEIIGRTLGVPAENMVYAHQTHTSNVMRVTKEHRGMGIIKERGFSDVDALITNEPGLCLVTGHADCLPLYFIDRESGAIGLAHAGWKGTAGNIAGNVIRMMGEEFGTKPKDVTAFIGPGICRDHYEVGEDVASKFRGIYGEVKEARVLKAKPSDGDEPKYLLNLHMANYYNMTAAGLAMEDIYISDVCTFCNPGLFFSHRYTKGQRGGMCAFLMIRE